MKLKKFNTFNEQNILEKKSAKGIKKKRKSESASIDDKYDEFVEKIKKMRIKAAEKFADKNIDISIRNIELKIKKYEIRIAEKELEILKLRDQKLLFKDELRIKKESIKKKNKK